MTKFLGIDYGTKKIGIAISDETGRIAFPYAVIANVDHLSEKIREICRKENINALVLGESRDFEGNPNLVMKKIIPFKKKLEKKLRLSVYLEPEFLTSKQARNILDGGKNDASAAALILQSFLDKRNTEFRRY